MSSNYLNPDSFQQKKWWKQHFLMRWTAMTSKGFAFKQRVLHTKRGWLLYVFNFCKLKQVFWLLLFLLMQLVLMTLCRNDYNLETNRLRIAGHTVFLPVNTALKKPLHFAYTVLFACSEITHSSIFCPRFLWLRTQQPPASPKDHDFQHSTCPAPACCFGHGILKAPGMAVP